MFWLHSLSATLVAKNKLFKGLLNIAQQRSPIIIQKMRKKSDLDTALYKLGVMLCTNQVCYPPVLRCTPTLFQSREEISLTQQLIVTTWVQLQSISTSPEYQKLLQISSRAYLHKALALAIASRNISKVSIIGTRLPFLIVSVFFFNLHPWYFWNIRFILLL